jgi:prepilin-type N-terminal cleavage/methylation domain-containing protein
MRNGERKRQRRETGLTPHSELRTPNSKGFTLIELAAVIIVLGIMIGIVIPSLSEITDANLRRSARHLTGIIRYLRDESEAKKAVYRLRFDVPNSHYWAEVLTFSIAERTAEFKKDPSVISTEGDLSGGTTFVDIKAGSHPDDPSIMFTPDGWVEKAFIHLRDGNGKDFTLIVKPLTGATELREGVVEEK